VWQNISTTAYYNDSYTSFRSSYFGFVWNSSAFLSLYIDNVALFWQKTSTNCHFSTSLTDRNWTELLKVNIHQRTTVPVWDVESLTFDLSFRLLSDTWSWTLKSGHIPMFNLTLDLDFRWTNKSQKLKRLKLSLPCKFDRLKSVSSA